MELDQRPSMAHVSGAAVGNGLNCLHGPTFSSTPTTDCSSRKVRPVGKGGGGSKWVVPPQKVVESQLTAAAKRLDEKASFYQMPRNWSVKRRRATVPPIEFWRAFSSVFFQTGWTRRKSWTLLFSSEIRRMRNVNAGWKQCIKSEENVVRADVK